MPIIGIIASKDGGQPTAPTGVTGTPGTSAISISYTAPSYTGKGNAKLYTATSSPGGLTGTSTSPVGPIVVSGLSCATAYTFTVTVLSSSELSAVSSASSPATPICPTTTTTTTTPAPTAAPCALAGGACFVGYACGSPECSCGACPGGCYRNGTYGTHPSCPCINPTGAYYC